MRSTILELLRSASAGYISGEDIARQLKISRTAVWKHVRELKLSGYAIESHSRKGYVLRKAPDLLLPHEIKNYLRSECLGKEVYYYDSTSSTNKEAKRLATDGVPEGAIVVSETQDSGRGRLSRSWVSPYAKGIWLSIVLRPHFLPQEAPKFTLLAAVAVTQAIEAVTGIRVGIKWPNDILYAGKKLVGILTEMNAEMDKINYVVVGIGINVNVLMDDLPEDLHGIATSLQLISGEHVSRVALLAEILYQMEALYRIVVEQGFVYILTEWKKYSITLGQEVEVTGLNERFTGRAVDIDQEGALLVDTEDGVRTVLAGDVSIRPKIKV